MQRLSYLAVLAFCFLATVWLELFLRVNVYRRWRRLALAVLPVGAVFLAWDAAAVAAGHWSYDLAHVAGVVLPGGLPLEEALFFVVVPTCAVLGFEAVRRVTGWRAGDEPAGASGGRGPAGPAGRAP